MRKRFDLPLLFAAIAVFGPGIVAAQDEIPGKVRLYGFVRNDVLFDSREVDTDPEEPYFFMPGGTTLVGEVDQNAVPSLRMLALTSRLGVKVSGYQIGETKVTGTIEGDFFVSSGSTATFRMRQAYMGLLWDNLELGDLLMNVGQTWHPMAADLPHLTREETGAPFNPSSRSPQILAHWAVGSFTWSGGVLYPVQYLPVGPSSTTEPLWNARKEQYYPSTTNVTVKSADFVRYGLIPEVYLGVSFQKGGFLARAGASLFSSQPRWDAPLVRVVDEENRELAYDMENTSTLSSRLFAVSPYVFLQYTHGSFQVKAKSVLAQSGEHMNLLSGYGTTYNWKTHALEYTPMQDWASFISFQAGRKYQVMCMLGYMQQIGTTKALFATRTESLNALWLNTSFDPLIQRAFRVTPTLAYHLGKLTFSLEYNCTGAWFGDDRYYRERSGLYEDGHWVLDHRIEQMIRFSF